MESTPELPFPQTGEAVMFMIGYIDCRRWYLNKKKGHLDNPFNFRSSRKWWDSGRWHAMNPEDH